LHRVRPDARRYGGVRDGLYSRGVVDILMGGDLA
jgi:hypothetical protein